MTIKHTTNIACLIATITASSASGVTIAEYTFDGGSTADSANDPTIIASNFSETFADSAGFSSGSSNAFVFLTVVDATIADALTDNEYFTFNVDPDGSTINLDSLDFTQSSINAKAPSSGGDYTVAVFSNQTGFTVGDELATFTINNPNEATVTENRSISLSSVPELQNVTTTTEFRFYFASDANYFPNAASNGNMRLDNVVLNTIPEPGAYALMAGLLAIAMLLIHQRKV